MNRIVLLAFFILLPACASTQDAGSSGDGGTSVTDATDSAVEQTGDGFAEAALSPLEDFNLRREGIPAVLVELKSPYGLPEPADCDTLAAEISRLTSVLGPDDDLPPPEEEDDADRTQWAADRSADAALGAVESGARGWIPFRGLVREATGAEAHARRVARAWRLGHERRAYLKGVGQAKGCGWPAAPLVLTEEGDGRIVYRGDRPG